MHIPSRELANSIRLAEQTSGPDSEHVRALEYLAILYDENTDEEADEQTIAETEHDSNYTVESIPNRGEIRTQQLARRQLVRQNYRARRARDHRRLLRAYESSSDSSDAPIRRSRSGQLRQGPAESINFPPHPVAYAPLATVPHHIVPQTEDQLREVHSRPYREAEIEFRSDQNNTLVYGTYFTPEYSPQLHDERLRWCFYQDHRTWHHYHEAQAIHITPNAAYYLYNAHIPRSSYPRHAIFLGTLYETSCGVPEVAPQPDTTHTCSRLPTPTRASQQNNRPVVVISPFSWFLSNLVIACFLAWFYVHFA